MGFNIRQFEFDRHHGRDGVGDIESGVGLRGGGGILKFGNSNQWSEILKLDIVSF